MLDDIGFVWDHLQVAWDQNLGHLKEFRSLYPTKWPMATEEFPAGNKLGHWCYSQRRCLKNDELSPERKARLDEIGFPWTPKIIVI